jgi:hypothetical protein
MPALKRTKYTSLFKAYEEKARASGDKNFCSPLAIALVCERSIEEVQAIMEVKGRKKGKPTYPTTEENTLDELGFKMKRVDIQEILYSLPRPHCDVLKNLTTHHPRRFPGCIDPEKRYLAFVRGHVLAIVGGEVQDWTINNSLRIYKLAQVVAK